MSGKKKTINGTSGDDVLVGTDKNDKIYGKSGNDEIRGMGGNDRLEGDSGNDTMFGGEGNDIMDGGRDDDVMSGDEGNDLVYGNRGDDIVEGNAGNDLVGGGSGNDVISGGDGNDGLYGGSGNDVLDGGAGKDRLYAGRGDDSLHGGDGKDKLYGWSGDDNLDGGEGDDKLYGGSGNDTLTGGTGDDRIRGERGDDHIIWSAGDGNDDIDGGRGEDTFTLNTSDNVEQVVQLDTNEDGDMVVTIDGEEGAELVLENIENFNLQIGQAGASIVLGDIPEGTLGDEPLDLGGGEGSDEIDASGSDVSVAIDAGTGDDEVTGGNADDVISGGEGSDIITGGGGDDVIDAGVGDDEVIWNAGDGNDTIDGGEGNDSVSLNLDDADSSEPASLSVQKDEAGNVVLVSSDGSTLTLDQVEEVVITAAASGTTITIGDLTGTDISQNTLYFNGGVGNDNLDASATDRRIVANGAGGDDVLRTGSGNDTLDGGDGNDFLDAGSGSGVDTVLGGSGDDNIQMTLGDEQGSDAVDIVDGGDDNDTLNIIFTEPTPHDLVLRVESNGDGSFTVTSEDIDVDEEVHVSNVEHLLITADEPGLHFILGTLSDSSLAANGVDFHGSAGNDTFNGSNTDIRVSMFGNDGDDNLIGGSAGDHFEGGTGNDSLDGEGGDDFLMGGDGNDIMDGGEGFDTADYSTATAGVTVNLNTTLAQDTVGAGTDTLVNIEQVTGSDLNDTLTAGNQGNTLIGNGGDDNITGGAGFDIIRGGEGNDTLVDTSPGLSGLLYGDAGDDFIDGTASYLEDPSGVKVNLTDTQVDMGGDLVAGRSAIDGWGDTDTYGSSTQNVWASQHDDHIIGSDAGQTIVTRAGNDTVDAGAGDDTVRWGSGTDTYDGGDGTDTLFMIDFNDAAGNPVQGGVVDLAAGTMTDGWGDTDSISNFENVIGSFLDDTITGDANDNMLLGLGGDDIVSGGAGNDFIAAADGNDILDGGDGDDTIVGATGDDTLSGGEGADTYRLITEIQDDYSFGHDTITDFDVTEDTIDLTPFDQYGAITQLNITEDSGNTTITIDADRSITLNGVSAGSLVAANFIFSGEPPEDPTSVGTEDNDILQGTDGDDVIDALGGNDRVAGLEGNDSLDGGNGIDTVEYSYDPAGVTVDLANNTATDGWGNTDTLANFENIYGSLYGDTLTGDDNDNNIVGDFNNPDGINPPPPAQGGDDIINAGGGDDNITPGLGVDTVDGGAGFDLINFLSEPIESGVLGAGVNVTYLPGSNYDFSFENPFTGDIENHTNIEWIIGTVGGDTVIGNDADNFFNGIVGNDYFDGGAGVDTFAASGSPEYIDLSIGEAFDDIAGGLTTTLINVENIIGAFSDHDDVLIGDGADNIIEGHLGDDTLTGGAGNDTLNGGIATLLDRGTGDPGTDTVNYSHFDNGTGVTVTLGLGGADGSATDAFGDTDTLQSIENITGSEYDDTLIGNEEVNILTGLGGVDTINAGAGDDFVNGGQGIDILDGGDGLDAVLFSSDGVGFGQTGLTITFSPTDDTVTSFNPTSGETEVTNNFEIVFATFGDDQITGDDSDNFINPFFGMDQVDGGAGSDTIFFSGSGINVDLGAGTGTQSNNFLGVTSFQNIENVIGSYNDDVISGDSGNNVLEGHDGSDILRGGAGDDTLNGGLATLFDRISFDGDGINTADYSQDPGGVSVNLATGSASDGYGGTDTLVRIDDVVGSGFNDSLTGDDNDNELEGLGGDDTLTGGDGIDQFRLNDDGNDNAAFGHDVVTDFNLSEDQINLRDFSNINDFLQIQSLISQDGADTLITFDAGNSVRLQNINSGDLNSGHFNFVESLFIEGTEGDDDLFGDDGNDTINALGGNDHVEGGDGNDIINGGFGNDQLFGGVGDDIIEAGGDWDNSYGEEGNDTITDSSGGGWLVGGPGNDTLTGSSNDWNELFGDEGDDVLIDPDGSGFLHGGPGNDSIDGQAVYRDDPGGIFFNLSGSHGDGGSWDAFGDGSVLVASRTAIDGWGDTDILEAGVRQMLGSNFDDFIRGSDDISESFEDLAGNDVFFGLSGDDSINVGSGNDYLDAGDNWDNLNFWNNGSDTAGDHLQGVVVNLSDQDFEYEPGVFAFANELIDPWGYTDQVFNFEAVNGTEFGDVIVGTDDHNWLQGNGGDDRIFGGDDFGDNLIGGEGSDYLDGQGGDGDNAWYNNWLYDENGQQILDAPGIIANLNTGSVQDQYGGTDTLVSIEGIEGSPYDDHITGDANHNWLPGNDGDDQVFGGDGDDDIQGRNGSDELYGEAGNDHLVGQEGDDLLDGGAGRDRISYEPWTGTTSGINVDLNAIVDAGGYTNVVVTPDGFGGTDYLRGIEDISGTDHADTIIGDATNNSFQGWAGADTLIGGAGDDSLEGRDENDIIDGGAGFDNIDGGENDDMLTGGTEGDVFRFSRYTDEGNPTSFGVDIITDFNLLEDTLDFNNVPEFSSRNAIASYASEDGNGDLVLSFITNDYGVDETNSITLQGLTLADLPNLNIWVSPILGSDSGEVINGGPDGEFIQALAGDDTVNAGDGDDQIEGGAGNDTLNGDLGNDWFNGGSGNDIIDGGDGHDWVEYGSTSRESENDFQQAFNSIFINMNLPVQVQNDGFGGQDTLINIENIGGSDLDDVFIGGPGNDSFNGHGGNDTIDGNDGDDNFHGNEGNDTLTGGNGNDWFQPGQGNDQVDGGAGQDHVNLDAWNQPSGVSVDLALGSNQVINDGFGSSDTLVSIEDIWGSLHNDSILGDAMDNSLSGNSGDDFVDGRDGNDHVHGQDGNDQLFGGAGDDNLFGEDGNDQLDVGAGNDWVSGGSGDDLFIFADNGDTNAWDHVDDFIAGAGSEDRIDFSGLSTMNSFVDVSFAATDDGSGNTNIDLGNGNILHLQGVSSGTLHEDDFIF